VSTNATETSLHVSDQSFEASAAALAVPQGRSRRLTEQQELAILADLEAKCTLDGIDLDQYAPALLALGSTF